MSTAFTPPGGTTPPYPPYASGQHAQPGPSPWPAQTMYQPAQRNGLAVAAVVMAGLSLLGVLGLGVAMLVGSEMGPSWALQGEVQPVNGQTAGDALERELRSLMQDDGSSVEKLTCPDSAPVAQGEVAVCHGSVDDWDWTGVVHFEDDAGTFTLLQF